MAGHALKIDPVARYSQRRWRGQDVSPVVEAQMFFDDQGPVPETYRRLRQALKDADIPFIVIGAMAVNAHGFLRATRDIDICMRPEDLQRFRQVLVGQTFHPVPGYLRRFVDGQTRTMVDILVSGELAGRRDRNHDIRFPDPAEAQIHSAVPTVSLVRLIELKLVTWRYQDWGDVVNLIRHFDLDEAFAENLHPTVRLAYRQCYDQRVEEDKYGSEA